MKINSIPGLEDAQRQSAGWRACWRSRMGSRQFSCLEGPGNPSTGKRMRSGWFSFFIIFWYSLATFWSAVCIFFLFILSLHQAGVSLCGSCIFFSWSGCFFYLLCFVISIDQVGAEEEKGVHQAGNQTRRSPRSYFLLWRAESVWSGESFETVQYQQSSGYFGHKLWGSMIWWEF